MSDEVPFPRRLYHYTCSHSFDGIVGDRGLLRPNNHPGVQPTAMAWARKLGFDGPIYALPVVWLTDVNVRSPADVDAIGLKGWYSECDRVEYRFRVPRRTSIRWWPTWADTNVSDTKWRKLIEFDCLPEHWWVSAEAIPDARLDEGYRHP